MEDKYEKALDMAIKEFEIDSWLGYGGKNEFIKREIEDLKEVKSELERLEEENAKYKALEQELGCPLEKAMLLFKVFKNKKYYLKYCGKIYECNNDYARNIFWSEQAAYICVSTNNEELKKEYNIYDTTLFSKDYGKFWWLEKPEEEE